MMMEKPGMNAGASTLIATQIDVEADVRYWEDATVDGVVDEDGSLIPGRDGHTWKIRVHLASGRIENWPKGVIARIHYKVCDQGEYWLSRPDGIRVAKWRGHYVPSSHLGAESGGDYIVMNVNGDGMIEGYEETDLDEERWTPLTVPDGLPPFELRRWACYVDEIDDTHVHLMMADETVDRDKELETGSFPKALLAHLHIRLGQYVTVRIMSDRRIDVQNTVFTEKEIAAGHQRQKEFVALIAEMREKGMFEPDAQDEDS